jgi:hypothetical protein
MSFKPFESGDESPTTLGQGGHRSSLYRRPESKARVHIAFILYFSDIIHTCSSIHTRRHPHKDEVVVFLNALPGSKKYFRNVKFGKTWLVWWIKANIRKQFARVVCLRFKCSGVLQCVERLRVTDVSVAGMPSSSGSYSARRCHIFAPPNLELKAVKVKLSL